MGVLIFALSLLVPVKGNWHAFLVVMAIVSAALIVLSFLPWFKRSATLERVANEDDHAAFETEGEGETEIEGGSVTGYPRVSKTKGRGRFRTKGTDVKR